MARSARRSRSPPRQSGSTLTFTPPRRRDEEQLLPLLSPRLAPERNEEDEATAGHSAIGRLKLISLTPSSHRRTGMRKPRIRGSSGFSRMDSVEGALMLNYLQFADDTTTTTSANIHSSPGSCSVEEQTSERKEENDSNSSSSPKHLSRSAPQEGRLEQFLEQRRRRSSEQQQHASPMDGTTKLVSKSSLNSMDTLRARANKFLPSEDASNPQKSDLPPVKRSAPSHSPSETNKMSVPFAVLAEEEGATTNVFLQLRFTGDSAAVHHYVGLPKAARYDGIVVMEDTTIVNKLNKVPSVSLPKGTIVPCAVRVGVTNSAA